MEYLENLENAKISINSVNSLAGRTDSLFTTVNQNYHPDIFDYDTEQAYKSLFMQFDSSEINEINLILAEQSKIKSDEQLILGILNRFTGYKTRFESIFKLDLSKDLFSFIEKFTELLNQGQVKPEWLGLTKPKQTRLLNSITKFVEPINEYYNAYDEVSEYFDDTINSVELIIIKNYLNHLNKKRVLNKVELTNSVIILEKHSKNSFFLLNRNNKIKAINKLIIVYKQQDEIAKIEKEVRKFIGDLPLKEIENILITIKKVFEFDYSFNNKEGLIELIKDIGSLNLREVNALNFQLQYDLYDFNKLTSGTFYTKCLSDELEVTQDKFTKLFLAINRMYKYEEELKNLYINKPAKLTVDHFKTINSLMSNYKKNKSELDSKKEFYTTIYGDNYKGEQTVFKSIRISMRNFGKFSSFFNNYDDLKKLAIDNNYRFLYESVIEISNLTENIQIGIEGTKK